MPSSRRPVVWTFFLISDITCKTPGDITNGQKTVTGTTYGSTVTYTCDPGYAREFGDMTRTCSETGRWTGLTPSCAGIYLVHFKTKFST